MDQKQSVTIKLKGGMGNQMFQYAFGRALQHSATKHSKNLKLLLDTSSFTNPNESDTRRPYELVHFNINADVTKNVPKLQSRFFELIVEATKKVTALFNNINQVSYVPSLLNPPYKKVYEGYWQSTKYFSEIENELRQEFTLRQPLNEAAKAVYEQIKNDDNSVSVFYRRTDYVGHKDLDIGSEDYQRRAIKKMRELVPEMNLYVMSDDIKWVEGNVKFDTPVKFVSSPLITPHEEMYLASNCRHHIIPNSTFAWWSAWLNYRSDKIVIAPKIWSNTHNHDWYADIVPEEWLRV